MLRSTRPAALTTAALAVTLALGLLSATPASAAVKLGAGCTKPKASAVVGKQRLVCTSIRGVKMWQRAPKTKTATVPASMPEIADRVTTSVASASLTTTPSVPVNPVVARIESRLASVTPVTASVPVAVRWESTPEVPAARLQSLIDQHQRLSDAYGDMYRWDEATIAVVSSDATWLRQRLEALQCSGPFMDFIRRIEQSPDARGAGTTVCGNAVTTFILNRGMSDEHWEHVIGSEFGALIQRKAAARSSFVSSGNRDWYGLTPTWYAEGGQQLLSAIAAAKSAGRWTFDIRKSSAHVSGGCGDDTMVSMRCADHYGTVALELGVALYGWDAPLTMLGQLDGTGDQAAMFASSFPDSFEKFSTWATAYLRYLSYGKPLPDDLLARLAG